MRIDPAKFDGHSCGSVSNYTQCGAAYGSVSIQHSGMATIEIATPGNMFS